MKALTFRLGQFALSALCLTILFRYTLHLCIGIESVIGTVTCSISYCGLIFFAGWYFGGKEEAENDFHDVGFRYHLTTYILCMAIGLGAYYIGWHTESIKGLTITAACWGIGLLLHLIFFLNERKKTIRGYLREEIFQ